MCRLDNGGLHKVAGAIDNLPTDGDLASLRLGIGNALKLRKEDEGVRP
jgi:hypothetical protein